MASFLFTTFLFDAIRGDLKALTDVFSVRLLTADGVGAVAKDMEKRSEISGQTGDPKTVSLQVTLDVTDERVLIRVGQAEWSGVTITALGAVVYQDTGTDTTDRLVACIQFDAAVSVTAGEIVIPEFDIQLRGDSDA